MPRNQKRILSVCPISKALDVVGDRWSLLIIRDMFAGKTQYGDFLDSPEGISTNILADRLRILAENGIIEKTRTNSGKQTTRYAMTPKGEELYAVIDAISEWSLSNIEGTRKVVDVPGPQ